MKYILFAIVIISFTFSCTNTQKKAPENSSAEISKTETPAESGKQAVADIETPAESTSDPIPESETTQPVEVQKKEEVIDKKTKQPSSGDLEKAAEMKIRQAVENARLETEKNTETLPEKKVGEKAALKIKEAMENARIEAEKQAKAEAEKKVSPTSTSSVSESSKNVESSKKNEASATPKISAPNAESIIKKVDKNMSSKSTKVTSEMVIHGKRKSRTVTSKGYAQGNDKSFTEYLSPAREKGTKMLKLEDRLWIYSPSTDRTIQLSGHMLKQSVMGSDLSYEDMMDDRKLLDVYNAKVVGEEVLNGRKTWVLELNAKVSDASYEKRKTWIDQERFIPLKEELFAKSGQLLKKTVLSDVKKIQGRWFPTKMNYKDMLKTGKGTDFIFKEIQFDPKIESHIFSKASLKQ